ncbi:unnamed protein product, partial [Rotaria sp. Silwood2]
SLQEKISLFFVLNIHDTHLQDIYRPITKTETDEISSHDEEKIPLTTQNNSSIDEKKKLNNDESLVNNEQINAKKLNYITIEKKKISSPNQTQLSEDDDAPILMPKQHKPINKSSLSNQRKTIYKLNSGCISEVVHIL